MEMNKEEIIDKVEYIEDLLQESIETALKSCLGDPYTRSEAIRYDPTINLIYRAARIAGKLVDERSVAVSFEELMED